MHLVDLAVCDHLGVGVHAEVEELLVGAGEVHRGHVDVGLCCDLAVLHVLVNDLLLGGWSLAGKTCDSVHVWAKCGHDFVCKITGATRRANRVLKKSLVGGTGRASNTTGKEAIGTRQEVVAVVAMQRSPRKVWVGRGVAYHGMKEGVIVVGHLCGWAQVPLLMWCLEKDVVDNKCKRSRILIGRRAVGFRLRWRQNEVNGCIHANN